MDIFRATLLDRTEGVRNGVKAEEFQASNANVKKQIAFIIIGIFVDPDLTFLAPDAYVRVIAHLESDSFD